VEFYGHINQNLSQEHLNFKSEEIQRALNIFSNLDSNTYRRKKHQMAGEIVFITGGSGHIGYRVIVDALKAGYRVRAAVRSQEKADSILSAPSIKAINPGDRLTFVEVPDLNADGAYDEAIKGAQYAIHIAAPIPSSYKEGLDMTEHFVKPSVKGAMAILTAAQKTGSVRRVIITSSVVAIIPWKDFSSGKSETVFDELNRVPTPSNYESVFEAYAASKVASLNETEAWIRKEKPPFDVIFIFPGFVIGRDELITDIKEIFYGTNKEVLKPVTGGDDGYIPGASVHVDDVAKAHVLSLDPKIAGNQGFILSSGGLGGTKWDESMEIVARTFPREVRSGVLPNNGKIVTMPVKIDESKTEKVLGLKLLSFEEQVKNVVGHYLELVGARA
jgi:nucleoside-diphosphate-sugar epimerase